MAVWRTETPREWHRRLLREGKIVAFEPDGPVPSREELERLSRGSGTAVSEALDRTRGEW